MTDVVKMQEVTAKLVAYRTHPRPAMRIVAAPSTRDWMDGTTGKFAYRCLPLLIANQSGWLILNSHRVRVAWDGSDAVSSVVLEFPEGYCPYPVSSHFGHGIITWEIPFLFRTPPGYNLLVRGPANWPKDGAYALEGVVETDWAVSTFTMNWKLMRAGVTLTFEREEPIAMIVPQRRGEMESFDPEIRALDQEPELAAKARRWFESRRHFIQDLGSPGSTQTWQKHYFQGVTPSGEHGEGHQRRLTLRPFEAAGRQR